MPRKTWLQKRNWNKTFFRSAIAYTILGYAFVIPSFLLNYHGSWNLDFTYGWPYLGTINALLIFILSVKYFLLAAKNKKVSFFLVLVLSVVFLLLNSLLFVHVKKHISFNACFVPGYSYPGTQPYEKCREKFMPEVHLKGLFCGGYGGNHACYTKQELEQFFP